MIAGILENRNMSSAHWLWLVIALLSMSACAQDQPTTPPTVTVNPPSLPDGGYPPAVSDQKDRSSWGAATYGKPSITLKTEKKLPNTGERIPEEAKPFIDYNDTWAANLGEDLQMVLNTVTYNNDVKLPLINVATHALTQYQDDKAVSDLQHRVSPITIPGAVEANRIDGRLYREGQLHYLAVITAQVDNTFYQLTMIYPGNYAAGPGDVEAIIQSIRIP